MLKIDNLTKRYKRQVKRKKTKFEGVIAVDHINLHVKKGEIFGFIGPNGAGKTTTLKMLSTLIIPDEGTAIIGGHDILEHAHIVRKNIGLLAGEFVRSLYWRLSARQNLKFFANLRGIWNPDQRINYLLELFNLKNCEDELVMKLSTGMKHKLALAVGLIHDPPVLFFDEPLTGIDPVTTFELKKLIRSKFSDKTIIWASHNLYEIEEMCDRVAFIKSGRIVIEGEPDYLKKTYWDHTKILLMSDNPNVFCSIEDAELKNNLIEIKTNDINKTFREITQISMEKGAKIIDIKTLKPSLEEIFMKGMKDV